MRIRKQHYFTGTLAAVTLCISFTQTPAPRQNAAIYYDRQIDTLLGDLHMLQEVSQQAAGRDTLKKYFFACRNAYKTTEFLIDAFNPYKARAINGPDLLKIEEENPSDSMKPHGFQVLEGIIYADTINKDELATELAVLIRNINQLSTDPDRGYYFKDDKIWEAMRLGMFRTISMGITGFDVPISYHALPETYAVLTAIKKVSSMYEKEITTPLLKKGDQLFGRALTYLNAHTDFNTFDRMTFIRSYLNPISEWLAICSKKGGFINYEQRTPLNPEAKSLFADDIIDLSFFSPNDNFKLTPQRVALGKHLFYDSQLSGNGKRSCATCHQPEKAFTDGVPKQTDLTGNKTLLRNTPTLWNTALQTRQFYDSRTEKLENQLSAVVHNTSEMDGSLRNSIAKLQADKSYRAWFGKAYPGSGASITEYNIANAISSYVRSLISLNSKFDKYIRGETNSFTASEKNGFNLFMGKAKCGTCHYAPVFNGLTPPLYQETESETLAVPESDKPGAPLDADAGKAGFTRVPFHRYSFKTPTVRNSALTAPYMHNGAFNTLDDVLKFYNEGGGAGRGIELATQTLPAEKLGLTKKEMKDIIAFLRTLTDTSGTSFSHYKMK